ncbi:hypothetical protein MMC20_000453 [Loxospora ochrophaea]|nr:hypothetical protein [Loxospora ochrophaea]
MAPEFPSSFPTLTTTWHNDTYPAISPTNPSLSVSNKRIIVSGAGAGIGRETTRAFAAAGAASIALIGRTLATLEETKDIVEKEFAAVAMSTHVADAADEVAVAKAAGEIEGWDVLVLNAARLATPASVEKSEVKEWWSVFETNVKGNMVMAHAFLPTKRSQAAIVGVSAAIVSLPTDSRPSTGASAYTVSKMAQIKLLEYIASENPDVFVAAVHPGIVQTQMVEKSGMTPPKEHLDDVRLPAHFIVWLTSPEGKFLRGKFVWANWDVDELKARAKEIEETTILTSNILGWPFQPKQNRVGEDLF